MKLLEQGDCIGLTACSNGMKIENSYIMKELVYVLKQIGLNPILSPKIYRNNLIYNGTDIEKGEVLNNFFSDDKIKAIFDISGGDMANGVLEYLDYDIIRKKKKPFFGYSDLTVVLNAIYTKTQCETYLYQIRNLIGDFGQNQIKKFKNTFMEDSNDELLRFDYEWIQGRFLKGIVIGGNIRCFLKLAGTEYMPDFKNKVVFFESLSGDPFKMNTYFNQLKQMGIFKDINGIILGSFSEMENRKLKPDIISIIKNKIDNENIPIIKTNDIGHKGNSKGIIIGKNMEL